MKKLRLWLLRKLACGSTVILNADFKPEGILLRGNDVVVSDCDFTYMVSPCFGFSSGWFYPLPEGGWVSREETIH